VTRNRTAAGPSLAISVILVLAACSTGSGGGTSSSEPSQSTPVEASAEPSAAANTEAFPVVIEHRFGETTIESEPQRIVAVGLTEQDALLALGIVPVGTTEWFGEYPGAIWPWAQDELGDREPPEVVGTSAELNTEAILALEPDLILALYAGLTEEEYAILSERAAVVVPPEGYVDYGIPWEELTITVGRAVGREAEAREMVAEVEELFAQAREEHPEFAGASGVVATPYEGIYVYGPEDVRGRLLTNLGFELPADLVEVTGEEFGGNLSEERSDMLDVDVIIWLDAVDVENYGGPLYESFAVHTEGREVFLDSFNDPLGGATSFVSVLSLPYLLEGLLPMLEAAVDGDPATEVPASP
jgi:iron complex transport system substrate-binding protein